MIFKPPSILSESNGMQRIAVVPNLVSDGYAFMLRLVPILIVLSLLSPPAGAEPRPNVLLVIADDLNCAIGPYGDDVAVTPNLNRLAARGLTFERAYCQQAVCNPSRSSFLTGLRPNTVKVDDLRKGFRESFSDGATLVTLPQHFKNHGYFCQNIGKIFHNMGETQDRRSWSMDEVLFKGTHAADTVFHNTPPSLRELTVSKAPVTEALDVPDTAYRDGQIANLAAAMLREHPAAGPPFFSRGGFLAATPAVRRAQEILELVRPYSHSIAQARDRPCRCAGNCVARLS